MRVAFVLPHSPEYTKISDEDYLSYHNYEHQYCKALLKLGHHVELFVLTHEKSYKKKKHIFGHYVNFIPIDFMVGNSEFSLKLLRHLLKTDFDIYHLHAYYFPMYDPLAIFCKFKNFNFVCQFHGKGPNQPRFLEHFTKIITLHLPSKVLCVTRRETEDVKKMFGLSDSKVIFFPNGLDTDYFKTRKVPRKSLGLEKKTFYLLFVGRLSFHNKGIDILIRAMKKLPDDVKLIVIGNGPDFNNMLDLIKKLDLNDRIIPLGRQNSKTVLKYYSVVDFVVLPSIFDFWPGVVLEGMYSKKPVIATKVGGIPDMIDNWKNGVLVSPGNENEIIRAVLKLKGDKKLAKRLGANAHKKIEKELSWNIIGRKLEEIYKEILNKSA